VMQMPVLMEGIWAIFRNFVCWRLGKPIDLSGPGDLRPEASQLVDCSGPVRICHWALVSQPLWFYLADPT
jgi:hypothetical protein